MDDDQKIDGFVLFLETIRNPRKFAEFSAAARRLGKPVIAYMLGKSKEGQALAVSHTGAMTGEADAIGAFLVYNNIAEVSRLMLCWGRRHCLTKGYSLGSVRATVVATTGGGGAMVVDQLCLRGVRCR